MNKLLLTILFFSAFCLRIAHGAEFFSQGSTQYSLLLGSATAFNNDYTTLGVGLNYFVVDGVSVGLSFENWSGNSPTINQTTPSIQYVLSRANSVSPYVGAYYRNISISGQSSINSVGGRFGVYFNTTSNNTFGLGLAYESYLNCNSAIFGSCSVAYPELSFIFGF